MAREAHGAGLETEPHVIAGPLRESLKCGKGPVAGINRRRLPGSPGPGGQNRHAAGAGGYLVSQDRIGDRVAVAVPFGRMRPPVPEQSPRDQQVRVAGSPWTYDLAGRICVEGEKVIGELQVLLRPSPDPPELGAIAGNLSQQHAIGLALTHRVTAL